MTAEIVNLNKRRKAKARAEDARAAEANRAKFGQSKAVRHQTAAEAKRIADTVAGAKRESAPLDENHDDLDPGTVS